MSSHCVFHLFRLFMMQCIIPEIEVVWCYGTPAYYLQYNSKPKWIKIPQIPFTYILQALCNTKHGTGAVILALFVGRLVYVAIR